MADTTLGVGDTVDGRFVLRDAIGVGAFGRVWRATDLETEQDVALKILKPALAEATGVLARFGREVDILCRLRHPGIVRYVAASNRGPQRYLAMEFVEGDNLLVTMGDRARGEAFTRVEVAAIVEQVASALNAAHDDGVVHRDLKPANIIVSPGPVARVLDFGVAKVALTPHEQTTVGRLVGTLMYMSPEQLAGQGVDPRADVFALATIAFELLTLRRPYARDARGEPFPIAQLPVPTSELNSHYAVLRRIAMEPRPRAGRHRDDISTRVDDVLSAGLHAVAADRTPDCVTFARDLASALAESKPEPARARAETLAPEDLDASTPLTSVLPQPLSPTAPDTSPIVTAPAAPPAPKPSSIPWLAAAFGVVLAVGVAAFVLARRAPNDPSPREVVRVPVREPGVSPRLVPTAVRVEAAVPDAGFEPDAAQRPPPREARTPPPPSLPIAVAPDAGSAKVMTAVEVRRRARALSRRADEISDASARTSIKRCASLVAVRADPADLEDCEAAFVRAVDP